MNAITGASTPFQAVFHRFQAWPQLKLIAIAAIALCLVEVALIFGSYAVFGPL